MNVGMAQIENSKYTSLSYVKQYECHNNQEHGRQTRVQTGL